MNISFDNGKISAGDGVEKTTAPHTGTRIREPESSKIFTWDISGARMEDTAYGEQEKTAEDIRQDAGQMDIATQKNYMIVMSNTMSDEDFAKLQEEGYSPGHMDMETVVTIVDEIKAALAKGGQNITGYTDDLDVETLTQITGSAGFANEIIRQFKNYDLPVTKENVEAVFSACETAMKIDDLNDGVIKYMLRNRKEPTVDNLYKAQYSASKDADRQGRGYYQDETGYYAKKAEEYNWRQLGPQMEKVIQNAGLETTEETLSEAKWLIEKGMPLTEDSLSSLHELRNLKNPETMEEMVSAAAAAIANGRGAGSASLSGSKTDSERAAEYLEDIASITGEAVDKLSAEGKKLNLRNLKSAQLSIERYGSPETDTVNISGRRQLEEVRLQMSFQANLHLIRTGFSIDTAELTQLVAALKEAETQYETRLFGGQDASERADLYRETLKKAGELPTLPAALIGRFVFSSDLPGDSAGIKMAAAPENFTLETAYQEGVLLRGVYERAGESYEALMTAPRGDLGDSIQKAFRNVDDILRDMHIETSEDNRRAVRILGYNSMEITEENIDAVKTLDLSVKRVVEKLTPAAALSMIREGVNPLSMHMEELEDYLDHRERDNGTDIEKYSEYLYKLDKKGNVTDSERDAYIGIYRLFRQFDKTDGAAVGMLLHQGAELTVGNLLTAIRSGKRHGMDITIDDSVGGVDSAYQGKSISRQIEGGYKDSYYSKLGRDIFDHLQDMPAVGKLPGDGMALEEFARMLHAAGTEKAEETENRRIDREYKREQLYSFREALSSEESVIKELLELDQPVTADNLLAAGLLAKERGRLSGKIKELADKTGKEEEFKEAVSGLHENMTDETAAKEAYAKMQQTFADILEEAVYGQNPGKNIGSNINIKEISNLYKQISFTGHKAEKESYEVPVNINGEFTAIHIKIIRGGKESGSVTASMESASYGRLFARFHVIDPATEKNEASDAVPCRMSGYIAGDSREGLDKLKRSEETLKKELKHSDINIVSLNFIYQEELDLMPAVPETGGKKETVSADGKEAVQTVSARALYETAKAIISFVQKG